MRWVLLWVMLCMGAWTQAGEVVVPMSIREHQWAYKSHVGVRSRLPQAGELPERIWGDVGRKVVRLQVSHAEVHEMFTAGTLGQYLRNQVGSVDDIIIGPFINVSVPESCTELEPIPTPEQEAWVWTMPKQWLAPFPEGYVRTIGDRAILSPWDILTNGLNPSARFGVSCNGVPTKGSGGFTCIVYWYDAPLTDEQVLIETMGLAQIQGAGWNLELKRTDGQVVVKVDVSDADRTMVVWPSGNRLVHLYFADRLYDTLVEPYLALHPSRWKERFAFKLKDLVLRTLDESLRVMRENEDGPLEYLRYSYRIYPFDAAFRRVCQVVMAGSLERSYLVNHRKAVDAIHAEWFKTPADRIQVADYRAAMVAYRRTLIALIAAERERIAKHGLELPR